MTTPLKFFACLAALALTSASDAAEPAGRAKAPVTITEVNGKWELVYAGEKFRSRDSAEAQLLLKAAELAQQRGAAWFALTHKADDRRGGHPIRTKVSYGEGYGHWQPHWFYRSPVYGWQPWYPEWGARFWADETDPRAVQRFEVHAIIELGSGVPPEVDAIFDVKSILADRSVRLAATPTP